MGPVVAILQARAGSTRYPRKVLEPILGEPMLLRQLERVRRAATIDQIVVATTDQALDDEVAAVATGAGYAVFRGSEDDVLARFEGAATAAGADVVVRLTGDCPLIDPELVDAAVNAWRDGQPDVDFVSNALSETFPDGMDVEVFSASLLSRAAREAELPSEREHVTPFMWKSGRFQVESLVSAEPLGHVRLTVDYPEDLQLVRAIYERLYPGDPAFGLDAILALLPELDVGNAQFERNAGARPSLERDQEFLEARRRPST